MVSKVIRKIHAKRVFVVLFACMLCATSRGQQELVHVPQSPAENTRIFTASNAAAENTLELDGEMKPFFKVDGYRDGKITVIFDETQRRVPLPEGAPSAESAADSFGSYDESNFVQSANEEPLFIPPIYRNDTSSREVEEASRSTTLPPQPPPTQSIPLPTSSLLPALSPSTTTSQPLLILSPVTPSPSFSTSVRSTPLSTTLPQHPQPQTQQSPPPPPSPPPPSPVISRPRPVFPQPPTQHPSPSQPLAQPSSSSQPPPFSSILPQFSPSPQSPSFVQPQHQPSPPLKSQTSPPPGLIPHILQRPQPSFLSRPQQPQPPISPPRPQPSQPRRPQQRPLKPFQLPPQPTPKLNNDQIANIRTGVCRGVIFYQSSFPSSIDLQRILTHFAVVVSVDQCARTCHEFNCDMAILDPHTRHCQFNPSTVVGLSATCPQWPNPIIYRNNIVLGVDLIKIQCITCQPKKRNVNRFFNDQHHQQQQQAWSSSNPQLTLRTPTKNIQQGLPNRLSKTNAHGVANVGGGDEQSHSRELSATTIKHEAELKLLLKSTEDYLEDGAESHSPQLLQQRDAAKSSQSPKITVVPSWEGINPLKMNPETIRRMHLAHAGENLSVNFEFLRWT